MQRKMKVKLLQRGGRKHHDTLEKAARFFAKELLPAEVAKTLEIQIELRAHKLTGSVQGECKATVEGFMPILNKFFEITLRRDVSLSKQISFLAHEMVHVAQRATGRLLFANDAYDTHARWEGKLVGTRDAYSYGGIPYRSLPWEVEAYSKQQTLHTAFSKAHDIVLVPV